MRKLPVGILIAVCSVAVLSVSALTADKMTFQIKKQPAIQQVKPKKPVKIKLKRSAEGKYAWELSGDDVNEVVKIDRRLRKLLGME